MGRICVGTCKNGSGPRKDTKNGVNNSTPSPNINHLQTDQRKKHVASLRAVKPPKWFLYQGIFYKR